MTDLNSLADPRSVEHKALVSLIIGYGGRCRGCADSNGLCESSGLPCDPDEAAKAINHVLTAHWYFEAHPGFIAERAAALRARAGGE